MKLQRLLFVDDEPYLLSGLRRMLRGQRECWEMHFIEDPVKALDFLGQEKVDLIVSDMRMPRMDGAQLLNSVRSRHPEVMRLGLSGFSESSLLLRGLGSIHQFLAKPCESDRLVSTLESLLLAGARLTPQARCLVASLSGLPCSQQALDRLRDELREPEPDLRAIQAVIAHDLGLATKVLQLVHSGFFGIPRQLADVHEACQMLGVHRLQSVLEQDGCFAHMHEVPEPILINFGDQANSRLKDLQPEKASANHLVTYLRDVGQLILLAHDPTNYQELLLHHEGQGPELWAEECRCYGSSNPELAAYLLTLWGFPASVTCAIWQGPTLTS